MSGDRIAQLRCRLAALGKEPCIRTRYLEGILQRVDSAPPAVGRRLLQRVEAGIADLEAQAASALRPVETGGGAGAVLPALASLRGTLDAGCRETPRQAASLAEALASRGDDPASPGVPVPGQLLQSARNLRHLRARSRQQQLITAALDRRPDAPGPLNPQGLLVRALDAMEDLSPAYLARLLDYSRTLLWLQGAGGRRESGKGAGGKG